MIHSWGVLVLVLNKTGQWQVAQEFLDSTDCLQVRVKESKLRICINRYGRSEGSRVQRLACEFGKECEETQKAQSTRVTKEGMSTTMASHKRSECRVMVVGGIVTYRGKVAGHQG